MNLFSFEIISSTYQYTLIIHVHDYFILMQDPDREVVSEIERIFSARKVSQDSESDMAALHMAIYKQHPSCARLLIEAGADVSKRDRSGLTPLMYAAMTSEYISN